MLIYSNQVNHQGFWTFIAKLIIFLIILNLLVWVLSSIAKIDTESMFGFLRISKRSYQQDIVTMIFIYILVIEIIYILFGFFNDKKIVKLKNKSIDFSIKRFTKDYFYSLIFDLPKKSYYGIKQCLKNSDIIGKILLIILITILLLLTLVAIFVVIIFLTVNLNSPLHQYASNSINDFNSNVDYKYLKITFHMIMVIIMFCILIFATIVMLGYLLFLIMPRYEYDELYVPTIKEMEEYIKRNEKI